MKVLISAYACEPNRGSEEGVGWNIVRRLARSHSLTVITRKRNTEVILSCEEEWVKGVRWVFIDPPKSLTFWKKGARGVQVYYLMWQYLLWRKAKELMKDETFDLTHHLTFGKYWVPSLLAGLNTPFVFGPVGGGESAPAPLRGGFSLKGKMSESSRELIQKGLLMCPPAQTLYRRAGWTLAATRQTEEALKALGVERVSVQVQSGLGGDELAALAGYGELCEKRKFDGKRPLRLVTACRLIHWKGVDLALETISELVKRGHDVVLTVLQGGPELANLKTMAADLGIADRITFAGRLPSLVDVYQEIGAADALLHPALHEAFGQSCLEALGIGVPVVCLKWGGPGLIVDDTCGVRISPGSREETVNSLSNAVLRLYGEDQERTFSAEQCRSRAAQFSWSAVVNSVNEAYRVATRTSGDLDAN
ncbi:glycosyltransferase [Akkermansiaceae bacterium]|nr:glycosyltransferase [Akkermansiaceae bacterium]